MRTNRPKPYPKELDLETIEDQFEIFVQEHKKEYEGYTYTLLTSIGTERLLVMAPHKTSKKLILTDQFIEFLNNREV